MSEFVTNGDKRNNSNPYLPSGGSSSSGSGGSGNAEKDQKENDALDNLAAIANYNAQALRAKGEHGRDMYNISDEMINRNWQKQTNDNKEKTGADWFEQLKKFQSSANQVKNAAGNSMTGSSLYKLWDLFDTENDSIRSEALNTQRSNQNDIDNDWYTQIAANVNARNELAADTEYGLKNILSDYAAQATSVAPDKIKERGLFAGDQGQGAGTINEPEWLKPGGYYDANKAQAAETKKQGFYLPDNAKVTAQEMQAGAHTNASAGNNSYWDNLIKGYNRRY